MIHLFLCFALFFSSPVNSISPHNTALLYHTCADHTLPTDYSDTLLSLFEQLVAHSSQSTFFTTLAGDALAPISGLFQCRGDLTSSDCYNCVSTLVPQIANTLCSQSAAARIQLQGCYVEYEVDGAFDRAPGGQEQLVWHKSCGEAEERGGRFEEAREEAFAAAESGVVIGDGFFGASYGGIEVMAQCDGDLRGCHCGECVETAMQIAREECGSSTQAHIFLDRCFFTYTYYYSPERGRSEEEEEKSGKTAAIVVGGAAAVCFVFIFLLFINSFANKPDDY